MPSQFREHQFKPNRLNVRYEKSCEVCGRVKDFAWHVDPPARDREFELEVTRHAAGHLDPEPINRMAGARADRFAPAYNHDFPDLTRDLAHEALEELADCRNYVVWLLDAIRRGYKPDLEWRIPDLEDALRATIMAFEALRW